jgi:hypothetical protein
MMLPKAGPLSSAAAAAVPVPAPCPEGASGADLVSVANDPTSMIALGTITELSSGYLLVRVTRSWRAPAMPVGVMLRVRGPYNASKAAVPLDSRIARPGVTIAIACGQKGSYVDAVQDETKGALEQCADTPDRDLAVALVATGAESGIVRACARSTLCTTEPRVAALAIAKAAVTYRDDSSTMLPLMDGLRVKSNGTFADAIGCAHAPLVDPKRGADDVNAAAVNAQLSLAARDGREQWLLDARDLLAPMRDADRKKVLLGISNDTQTAALAAADKLPPEKKKALEPLASLLHR